MEFPFCDAVKYEVALQAVDGLRLPPYKGSTLEGALDASFRGVSRLLHTTNVYRTVFEPRPAGNENTSAPSRFKNLPRPYVIEPPEETKTDYLPGEEFSFGLVLFGKTAQYFPYLLITLQTLGQEGIGRRLSGRPENSEMDSDGRSSATAPPRRRGRVALASIRTVHPLTGASKPVYLREQGLFLTDGIPITADDLDRHGPTTPIGEVSVTFQTPTRIKHNNRWVNSPSFAQLVLAILRRLEFLSRFYGNGQTLNGWKELLSRAEGIRVKSQRLRWFDWERHSGRQRAFMTLGGIVGEVVYQGEGLTEFVPYLLAGQVAHVGKGYVYGMGKYEVKW